MSAPPTTMAAPALEGRLAAIMPMDEALILKALIDHTPEFLYAKDAAGRFIFVNRALALDLGRSSPEELIGHTDADFYPAALAARFEADERRLLALGEPVLDQLEPQSVPGMPERWKLTHKVPMQDEAGRVVGLVGSSRDVTERHRLERELARRETLFQALAQHAGEIVAVVDGEGIVRFVSPTVERILGYRPQELLGTTGAILYHPGDLPQLAPFLAEVYAAPAATATADLRVRHADGSWRWFEVVATNLLAEAAVAGVVVNARDVTDRRLAETELAHERDLLHQLMDNLPEHVFFKDVDSRFVRINRTGADSLGLGDPAEAVGRTDADFLPAEIAESYVREDQAVMSSRLPAVDLTEPSVDGEGNPTWISTTKAPTYDAAGNVTGIVGISRDVTVRVALEEELRFQGELLDQATAAVIATDPNGVVTHWNRHAERLYGWSRVEAVGRPIGDLTVGPAEAAVAEAIIGQLGRGLTWEGEFEARRKDGSAVHVHVSDSPVLDPEGRLAGIVGVSVDVSERRALEERLTHLAYVDSLTGLANRTRFLERLQAAIDEGTPAAILLFDLDRFKAVNDSLGHGTGDQVLVQTARRMAVELRPGDVLARLGGDEFAALVYGVDEIDVGGAIAGRVLTALEEPFLVGRAEAVVSGSAGVALLGSDGDGVEEALRAADLALYEAKRRGRSHWAAFDEEISARARNRSELETDLRRAVDERQLLLHYQPVVDLAQGHVRGFEALVRWSHPTRGLIPPADFIPLAEETGLIVPIGEWVLGEACRQGAAWRELRPDLPLTMAVNVSPRQFSGETFGHALWRVLGETGLPPDRLKLEVTEQALAEDAEVAASFLRSIKSLGVRLALDDFGVGYSSLGRLHLLPLDALKLDRSFIEGLGRDPHAAAFVRLVIELGRELALRVTAEGIETEAQRRIASDLGCEQGQGYLFSRPVAVEAATAYLMGSRLHGGVQTSIAG